MDKQTRRTCIRFNGSFNIIFPNPNELGISFVGMNFEPLLSKLHLACSLRKILNKMQSTEDRKQTEL